MENDLIFGAEASDDTVFGAADGMTQIAAAAPPSEEPIPTPRDAAKVVVPQGETVVHVPVAPGEIVELPFPADAHFLARLDDGNLAIKVGDLTIILEGYAEAAGQTPPVIEDANGQPLDIAAILAATDPAIEIETAAGPAGAQGQGADNTGALLTQFIGAGGGLGGFTGAGGQEGSDTPGSGPGVDQTGTLFKQFADVPTPTAPSASDFKFTTDEESKITGKVVATDPQGDVLTYSLVGAAPAGLTLNLDGSWTFDPVGKYDQLNTDHPGQISFQYKANDGVNDSNTATVTIDIDGVNDAPKFLGGNTGIGFAEDFNVTELALDWQVTDPDDTDFTITVDKSTLPPGLTFDSSTATIHFDTLGQYDYLKAGETANFTLKFTVTDAHGGSFERDFPVQVYGENDAPVAANDIVLTNAGTGENGIFSIPDWALLVNDKDVDSADLGLVPAAPFATGLQSLTYQPGNFVADEDDTLGGSIFYKATDGSDDSKTAAVGIQNQEGGDITGTDADEILIGGRAGGKLDGGGGNDIIIVEGGNATYEVFGGAGDDILRLTSKSTYHGGTDTVASSGGLASAADNHGDVLALRNQDLDLTDSSYSTNHNVKADGIETISTQAKLGAGDAQTLTVSAAGVQLLSDHTITPGGGFDEHEAIRIDGDSVDQIFLSQDGGKWVDTAIEMVGYHVYAHETKAGDPASTDAYVMVQAANVGNVHLNPPVANDDRILTTVGQKAVIDIPEWALLANDIGGPNLDVESKFDLTGLNVIIHSPGVGTNGTVEVFEDDTLGGSFKYQATDDGTLSKEATVSVYNQNNPTLDGTDADEILVGNRNDESLSGGGGNDIIFGGGGTLFGDDIDGGAGDDVIDLDQRARIDGGTDSVASSGGLAAGAENHGDVLIRAANVSLIEAKGFERIETISTEVKFGGVGAQTVTIDAASVQHFSDHTITPGGAFAEHDAIRIDGDAVDQLYLTNSTFGGQWVDTSIEVAGYRVYAHETTAGDAASTDAYVMVQAANTANVHLNQDGAPTAVDDIVLTNRGTFDNIFISEWALLANDKTVDGADLNISGVSDVQGSGGLIFSPGLGANGTVKFDEDANLGGSFDYKATDGGVESNKTTVSIHNQEGGDITGTDADEILIGGLGVEELDGGAGNDIIFSVGAVFGMDVVSGGAGDDIISLPTNTEVHGDTDNVASSGGLAADVGNHGDRLLRTYDLDLSDPAAAKIDGIETITTEAKFGADGVQTLTISAASVQQLSDHTITPGSGFGEHDAIRIDGDSIDEIDLSSDDGKWVDTAIEMAGYRVYAHETISGDPASTDAYVMVQAANVGNVHLNLPVAHDDRILTTVGTKVSFEVPEWALLANDSGGPNLNVAKFDDLVGLSGIGYSTGASTTTNVTIHENDTPGGSFKYQATDDGTLSKEATVSISNSDGAPLVGTDADEILVGSAKNEILIGSGGNDIIFGRGGFGDQIYGGDGDDIIDLASYGLIAGGADNVAMSGGLAASADNHGDVLIRATNLSLVDATKIDGVETISTQEKFGGTGAQVLTIDAAGVQQISDQTITPGGGFGEHDAIRIDGDLVDQLYLAIGKAGGQWVDTSIEVVGYHVYAHETTGGDPASADAYVMVQAANTANVHLNQDGAPVAVDDIVLSNLGTSKLIAIPEWALLANDKSVDGAQLDVADFNTVVGAAAFSHPSGGGGSGSGSNGALNFSEDTTLGGSFGYTATDGNVEGKSATVAIHNQEDGDITGTDADEILIGGGLGEKIDGGGGNDIIFGGSGGGDEIFGGAGDDTLQVSLNSSIYHGGTDTVATSGGLAAAAGNHGDVLTERGGDWDLSDSTDAVNFDGIETISTEAKLGVPGAQKLTISAASVQQLSDHTITPGGGFGEHDAIRIDGDAVDQVNLSISKDGGQWVDTAIEMAGYHIYAHETTGGNKASTDAYVMVQAANVGNVHLQPFAADDILLTNVGTAAKFSVPEWALLANDTGTNLDVSSDFAGGSGLASDAHNSGTGSNGTVEGLDKDPLGGTIAYKATDGYQDSADALLTIHNQAGGDITGTAADEILVGSQLGEKIDGGGGNDIIFGGGDQKDLIFGGAGDDFLNTNHSGSVYHGGTDNVASSGGLAASIDNHGDVLIRTDDLDLSTPVNAANFDGIETISTEAKFGGVGAQAVTISAASVQQLSDHTITPGGVFAEHEAIRIDGDAVDQLFLSISKDGGQWVNTAIDVAGYHIFAHETTAGDAASTDAYVMVGTMGNVVLNQDAP